MKINIHMQKSNHFSFFSSSKYFTIHEKNASNIWTSCIRFLYYSIYSEIIEFRNYASKARENFRVSSRGKRRKREGVRERERVREKEEIPLFALVPRLEMPTGGTLAPKFATLCDRVSRKRGCPAFEWLLTVATTKRFGLKWI